MRKKKYYLKVRRIIGIVDVDDLFGQLFESYSASKRNRFLSKFTFNCMRTRTI